MSHTLEAPLIAQLTRKKTQRVPCWFMRQAGRYLPEYRAIRAKHSMLDVIRTPELSSEVTLQPLRRFDLDAAIIFADILNPLIGMGIDLDFKAGEGPVISNPVRTVQDVQRLRVPDTEENVGYTLKAIKIVASELESRNIPLIGFSGSPFTLTGYLMQEPDLSSSKMVKHFALTEPKAWSELQDKLAQLVSDYLIAQAKAGARALQLFDSWVGALSPQLFAQLVAPTLSVIVKKVRAGTSVPLIYFGVNSFGLMSQIKQFGFDCVGVDWRTSLSEASAALGPNHAVQGNLDAALLCVPGLDLKPFVKSILQQHKNLPGHVFNVGHGVTPDTQIDSIQRVIEHVREYPHD